MLLIGCGFFGSSQDKYNDTIPFRDDLGLIIIPISFNGVEKEFAFDTGAQLSVGFSWIKEELKKTRKTNTITSSSGLRTKARFYKSDSVNLGGARITKHRLLGVPDSAIFSCFNLDGILGMDIIENFNWTINYEDNYLIMHSATYVPEMVKEFYEIDFSYGNRKPSIYSKVQGQRVKFLWDTGAVYSDINSKQIEPSGDNIRKRALYSSFFDVNGIRNQTKSLELFVPDNQTGQVTLTSIFDYSNKSTKMGNAQWKDNTLFFSANQSSLYSQKQFITEERLTYDCSFVIENGKIIVAKVFQDSEAWGLGIRMGDEVKSLNDRSFQEFCSLAKFTIEMHDNDENITVRFANGTTLVLQKKAVFTEIN